MPIFSDHDIEYSYSNSDALIRIQRLITEHSTNQHDIRDAAFSDIDFSKVNHILDLGCAFGYSILGLKKRIRPGTHIVGFDLQESYQKPYLAACRKIGANGEFHISDVAELATFPAHFFDLVIACYSMYFFPDSLDNIAGVLKKDGSFIAITHSEDILRELIQHIPEAMNDLGVKLPEILCIQRLFQEFSCENGHKLLQPFFGEITNKPFNNRLSFTPEELNKFADYVEMKKHLFLKEAYEEVPDNVTSILDSVMTTIGAKAAQKGWVEFNKNDCVFICRNPLNQKSKRKHHSVTPHFCSSCGSPISEKKIDGRNRGFCTECGYIVYKNPLPVAAAIVCNERQEILLVRRANHPMRGMWCLPCGFAEIDEEIDEATLRELLEETNLVGENCSLVDASNSHNFFYGNLLMVTYLVKSVQGTLQAGDDAADARYFAFDDLPILAFPAQERALNIFLRQNRCKKD
jgi:8-oxo-dGTP diphosphatase